MVANALPPLALAISAFLAFDGWKRMPADNDSAIVEFMMAGMVLLFAVRSAFDTYFYKPPLFRPQPRPGAGSSLGQRALIFAVGAIVTLLALHGINQNPRDVFRLLGGGGAGLIGILVMVAAWRARERFDDETKLRMLWWALAGLFSIFAAAYVGKDNRALFLFVPLAFVFTALAVRASMRFGRFGRTYLEWEREPLQLGQTIRGRLRVNRVAVATEQGPIVVTLNAFSQTHSRAQHSRSNLKKLWSSTREIPIGQVEMAPNQQVTIPIEFTLPTHVPASGWLDRTSYTWQLDVKRAMEGIDYSVSFSVVVAEG